MHPEYIARTFAHKTRRNVQTRMRTHLRANTRMLTRTYADICIKALVQARAHSVYGRTLFVIT